MFNKWISTAVNLRILPLSKARKPANEGIYVRRISEQLYLNGGIAIH